MDEWFNDWFDEDYAALYAHRDALEAEAGVATALEAAPELLRGPVLDLGCGTGRHLEVLRHHNPKAIGMDLSQVLLKLAPVSLRGHLLRGDMRRLPLRAGSLAGLCLWFTPFGYFDDATNHRLIRNFSGVLEPGGILVLDYLNAHHLRRHLVAEDEIERNGLRVRSQRTLEQGRVVKRMTLTRMDSGATREVVESVRVYDPEELLGLATEAGLRLRQAFGTYEGGRWSEDSPRWLALFEKR